MYFVADKLLLVTLAYSLNFYTEFYFMLNYVLCLMGSAFLAV